MTLIPTTARVVLGDDDMNDTAMLAARIANREGAGDDERNLHEDVLRLMREVHRTRESAAYLRGWKEAVEAVLADPE